MGSRKKPRRSRANALLRAEFEAMRVRAEENRAEHLAAGGSGCAICDSGEPCPYHLHDYCRAKGTCYCHLYADWEQLGGYIDEGDFLRCSECDQRVPWGWVWIGPENMTDADLRAMGKFRRGDYFKRVIKAVQ